jgi:WD40 repeat protein
MEMREKTKKAIVPAASESLATRSAAVVTRGLRDLGRGSKWLRKRVFSTRAASVSVSPSGQLCAVFPRHDGNPDKVAVYELELKLPPFELAVRSLPTNGTRRTTATFGFSPDGRHLMVALSSWPQELHIFDLQAKGLLGKFGPFSDFPSALAWSHRGRYFAMSSRGAEAYVRIWGKAAGSSAGLAASGDPESEFPISAFSGEASSPDAPAGQISDEGSATGFGRVIFSLDEQTLASVVEIEGEWADDSIQLLEVPGLDRKRVLHAQGHITDVSWAFDGRLIYCSGGQAFHVASETMEPERLPFGAELCACHPRLPLCVCFSSWLKDSAKEKLFAVNLDNYKVLDELPVDGIADLRWSRDGLKAYAVTTAGLAYIYEPTLL